MTRLRRLRTRLVVVFGATFVVMQLANAAYLLLASRRAGRERLEATAHQYALIATPDPHPFSRFAAKLSTVSRL